ncbi:MFS transporter [Desulfobacterota bacterium AH_259_B03_O07]|nr:MFS transporter [Desulfobacterota bacterium AH_259_B03_O07]
MAKLLTEASRKDAITSYSSSTTSNDHSRAWILAVAILGSSMAFIDSTAIALVLPVLQIELGASVPDVQWIIAAYALFLSSLILLGGSLGDHFGRRRVFALGVVLFTIASVSCGLAADAKQLIVARAFQGIGGALLVPGSLAIINISFSKKERGKAFGTWTGFIAITTSLGPVLGGWLVENLSWRWIFFINVPLAFIVLFILFWRVPETRNEKGNGKLDIWGSFLVTIGLSGLILGLIESSNFGFNNPMVFGSLLVGILMIIAFIAYEARTDSPMMPLYLFKSKAFSGGNLITLLLWGAWVGAMFFIPFNFIQIQGYSPTTAGIAFLPMILMLFLLSRWSGGKINRYGAKFLLVIGPILIALGYIMFTIPGVGSSYWTTFLPALVVLGMGMGISVAPLTTVVMGAVDIQYSGLASGINNSVGRVAGLLAVAVLGVVALKAFNSSLDPDLSKLQIPPEYREIINDERIKLAAMEIPEALSSDVKLLLKRAIANSFVDSFRLIMIITGCLALASGVCSWIFFDRVGKRSKTVVKDEKAA